MADYTPHTWIAGDDFTPEQASEMSAELEEQELHDMAQDAVISTKQDTSEKGMANGYCPLDSSVKVPAAYLPAYVDDVLEYANLAAFPSPGTAGIIYVAMDTNKQYRWSGSTYAQIITSPGSTDAVPEGATNLYYTNARADARADVRIAATVPELTRDTMASALVAGTNITITPNDAADQITIAATGGGGGLDTEAVQDAVAAMIVPGTNVTTSYNDTAGTLSISSTSSGSTPTLGGVVQLDSFAGANDDAKLTAALSYAAAQTFRPAIQFPARSVTLTTGGRTPFNGMKLIGPFGAGGPKNPELSSSYVNHIVHLNVGTGTSSWFYGTSDTYDVYIKDLCFQCDGGTSQFWHQPSTTLYACQFHALTFYGMRNIFGNASTKCLMTQVMFTGHWTVIGFLDTQFYIGGSDCCFWADAQINIGAFGTVGGGVYYMKFETLGKTKIGYVYGTSGAGWKCMQLSGSGSGTSFHGGTFEGLPGASPATVPLIDITGGQWSFFGTMFNQVNSSGNNGAIIQSGGDITLYSPAYIRYSGTADTWPMLYQTGGTARVIGAASGTGSENVRVRWSDGTTSVLTPQNKTII